MYSSRWANSAHALSQPCVKARAEASPRHEGGGAVSSPLWSKWIIARGTRNRYLNDNTVKLKQCLWTYTLFNDV